jgi:hypothetical protein
MSKLHLLLFQRCLFILIIWTVYFYWKHFAYTIDNEKLLEKACVSIMKYDVLYDKIKEKFIKKTLVNNSYISVINKNM